MSLYDSVSISELASEFVKLGFSVFPCHTLESGSCSCGDLNCANVAKHPLTDNGVHGASNDPLKVETFFSGDYSIANIAIACGSVSGVWILDVDDPSALAALESQHGPLPQTWTVQTGSGGRHLYFRCDERSATFKNAVKFAGSLDIRTDGGYVLAPPSIHKSGKRYRWIVSPADCEIAVAPDWLVALIPKRESVAAASVVPLASVASINDPPTSTSTLTIQRAKSLADRMRLYLAKSPVAVSGDGGHKVTFAVVSRCVELFGLLCDDEFISALETWNVRCSPPWTESELRHKLSDCRKQIVTQSPTATDDPTAIVTDVDLGDCAGDDFPVADPSAFYGLLGEIVRTIEPETESDPMAILVSLLTICGHAIGGSPHTLVGPDRHGCNLFSAIVGDTASGKGMALSIAKYVAGDLLKDTVAYGLSSGEGLIERVGDPMETDGKIVFDGEKKLLCIETEFAKPIGAMCRESCTLSPVLRSAWDCSTLEVLTKGKSKLQASNAFVSILAHVTPEELSKLFSDSVETSNGFVNRFLWALVRSSKSLPSGGNVAVLNPYRAKLSAAIAKAKTLGELKRTAEAETQWKSVYDSLKASKPGSYGKAVERGRAIVVRLSLIFALLDGSSTITTAHLSAALAVWRYCDDSARIIFADDATMKLETKIIQVVRNRPGIHRSELRKIFPHDRKTTAVFNSSLESLALRGKVVIVRVYENRQADTVYPGVTIPPTSTSTLASVSEQSDSPTSAASVSPSAMAESLRPKSVTIADVVNWKNANGIRFIRDGGRVWVTPDCDSLSPEIEQWLRDNQDTLAMFVPKSEPESKSESLTKDEFFSDIKAGLLTSAAAYAAKQSEIDSSLFDNFSDCLA